MNIFDTFRKYGDFRLINAVHRLFSIRYLAVSANEIQLFQLSVLKKFIKYSSPFIQYHWQHLINTFHGYLAHASRNFSIEIIGFPDFGHLKANLERFLDI